MSTATADLTTRVDRIEFAASYDLWGAVAPAERDAAGLMLARRGACRVVGSRLPPGAEMLNGSWALPRTTRPTAPWPAR